MATHTQLDYLHGAPQKSYHMKRLFTFGCSFTQYWRWPTWADALGRESEYFENWGQCGAGNCLIFYNLMECHQRNRITPEDQVYVMWTNTSREDRYVGRRWLAAGNIYWMAGNEFSEDYIRRYTCERGYLIRDLAVIAAARQLLQSWGCEYRFFSMVPLTETNETCDLGYNPDDVRGTDADVRELYRDVLDAIGPSVFDTVFRGNWQSRPPGLPDCYTPDRRDFHPTPLEHLEYLDQVMPGAIKNNDTRLWMMHCERLQQEGRLDWREPNLPARRL